MFPSLAHLLSIPRTCPHCGTTRIDHVPRRGSFEVLVLPALRLRVFSCHDCQWRFYSWKRDRSRQEREHGRAQVVAKPGFSWPLRFSKVCPMCGDRDTRRSHRNNSTERMLSWGLRLWPFRCMECHHRFFAFSLGTPRSGSRGRKRVHQQGK